MINHSTSSSTSTMKSNSNSKSGSSRSPKSKGETPRTPKRSINHEHKSSSSSRRSIKDVAMTPNKKSPVVVSAVQQIPEQEFDPRRSWELAPFRYALHKFIESNQVFQRPKPSFQIERAVVLSSGKSSVNVLKSKSINNKHSIISLLQMHNSTNKDDSANEQLNEIKQCSTKVGAQTQTETDSSHPTEKAQREYVNVKDEMTKCEEESISNDSKGSFIDDYSESFPSYDSRYSAPVKEAETENDEKTSEPSFPSYGQSASSTSRSHVSIKHDETKDEDLEDDTCSFPSYNSKSTRVEPSEVNDQKRLVPANVTAGMNLSP